MTMQGKVIALVVTAAALLGACSSGDDSSSQSDATSTRGNGSATIEKFEVPDSAECAGATSVTTSVSYRVEGAERQELLVDGARQPGTEDSEATLDVPVHCDDLPHTFVLIAYDSDGKKTAEQKLLTTVLR